MRHLQPGKERLCPRRVQIPPPRPDSPRSLINESRRCDTPQSTPRCDGTRPIQNAMQRAIIVAVIMAHPLCKSSNRPPARKTPWPTEWATAAAGGIDDCANVHENCKDAPRRRSGRKRYDPRGSAGRTVSSFAERKQHCKQRMKTPKPAGPGVSGNCQRCQSEHGQRAVLSFLLSPQPGKIPVEDLRHVRPALDRS